MSVSRDVYDDVLFDVMGEMTRTLLKPLKCAAGAAKDALDDVLRRELHDVINSIEPPEPQHRSVMVDCPVGDSEAITEPVEAAVQTGNFFDKCAFIRRC